MSNDTHRRHDGEFHWQDVEVLAYKQSGEAPFKDVTRQVLFEDPDLGCQWRYFEVAPGGHTTLERHQHVHAVMVVRGHGRALVGAHIHELANHDLVKVPALTWHQFRAPDDQPLGFLCLVNAERDRPQLPQAEDLEELRADAATAEFIRV
ncbi:MAG: cupin domain-containing protein [Gammaproteobacteria bacterium]|nr:cupin domain-containing protein [Gammaproteobacteria bacterium]